MFRPFFIFLIIFLIGTPMDRLISQAVREKQDPGSSSSFRPPSPPLPTLEVPEEQGESLKRAISLLPEGKLPVTDKKDFLYFLRNLGPGEENILLIAVQGQNQRLASLSHLSNMQRLYDPLEEDLSFSVEVFLRKNHELRHWKSIDLGSHRVCIHISTLPFRKDQGFPYGLSLIFPTTGGKEHLWVLFSSPEIHRIFSFSEKADVKAYIRDLNAEGIPDLLLFEDIFEDAQGYETYVSWFKWDGRTYRKEKSTNIVRNLRTFFNTAGELLSQERWQNFLDFSLDPKFPVNIEDCDLPTTLDAFFTYSPVDGLTDISEESSFSIEIQGKDISQVVFPEVLENPFPLGPDGPESFTLTFRIGGEEEYLFFTARLGMNPNPFEKKMFYFLSE